MGSVWSGRNWPDRSRPTWRRGAGAREAMTAGRGAKGGSPVDLSGPTVRIRSLRSSDAEPLDGILRDRHVTRMLPERVRREGGSQFVARALREEIEGGGPAFAILPHGSKEVIGQIRFVDWSRSEGMSEVGSWIR